jgi:hypothetical protein
MIFSSFLISELYREQLFNFLKESVLPIYEDFLKNQLRFVNITPDQQNAIMMYCKTIMKENIKISGEFDMNDAHQVFDHMRKNILLF